MGGWRRASAFRRRALLARRSFTDGHIWTGRRPVLLGGWSSGCGDRWRSRRRSCWSLPGGFLRDRLGGLLGLMEGRPTLLGGGHDAGAPFLAQHTLRRLGRYWFGCCRFGLGGVVRGPPLLLSQGDALARRGAHGPFLCAGFRSGGRGLARSRLTSKVASQIADALFKGAEHVLQPNQRSLKEFRIVFLGLWHCLIILLGTRLSSG